MSLHPITVIIPTLNRPERLRMTLLSLLAQSVMVEEIIVIDATTPPLPALPGIAQTSGKSPRIQFIPAEIRGAASQRNQGVARSSLPFVLFLDDDIDLEPDALARLWFEMQQNPRLGAVGVWLDNQHYHPPGRIMRHLYTLLGCPAEGSLAGSLSGPGLNFLPDKVAHGHSAQWLNLCCTLCRREALPCPPLLPFFTGYSLLEDAALTAYLARRWQLLAVPAGVHHDYRAASYKDRVALREKMEVMNRWFLLSRILGRQQIGWVVRFVAYQFLMSLLSLRRVTGWRQFPAACAGKISGYLEIAIHSRHWKGYTN